MPGSLLSILGIIAVDLMVVIGVGWGGLITARWLGAALRGGPAPAFPGPTLPPRLRRHWHPPTRAELIARMPAFTGATPPRWRRPHWRTPTRAELISMALVASPTVGLFALASVQGFDRVFSNAAVSWVGIAIMDVFLTVTTSLLVATVVHQGVTAADLARAFRSPFAWVSVPIAVSSPLVTIYVISQFGWDPARVESLVRTALIGISLLAQVVNLRRPKTRQAGRPA